MNKLERKHVKTYLHSPFKFCLLDTANFLLSVGFFCTTPFLSQVFLYKGELHILPCPSKSTSVGFSKDVVPSVAQALELLYTHPEGCRASSKISLALKKRLEG